MRRSSFTEEQIIDAVKSSGGAAGKGALPGG